MPDFVSFDKIARWSRNIVVTEKIDGTNACVYIGEDGEFLTGSRTRWITPADDNYGFSRWAHDHKDELMLLGPGTHYGEWWGAGIQRKYGVSDKRFSLFNVGRWKLQPAPSCCRVVPVLYDGIMNESEVVKCIDSLVKNGSVAAPGFMDPEGVVIYHVASRMLFKKTIVGDEKPKGSKE